MDSNKLVDKIVEALQDKKAKDISIIDIHNITVISDYFVICSGTSNTHITAIANEVEFALSKIGLEPYHKEGFDSAQWILLDYADVVVHVFHEEDRRFYNLERLWSDGLLTNIR